MRFYSLKPIIKQCPDALYYIIFGERSNGKTFSVKELSLFGIHEKGMDFPGYLDDGSQLGVIRRWKEDFRGKNGKTFFDDIVSNPTKGNLLEKKTDGKWNDVLWYSSSWWLIHRDESGDVDRRDVKPFCFAFPLADEEHLKGTSYPDIRYVLFDEFITRHIYLVDEVTSFFSVLSTIVRQDDRVRIFMMGNTVNKYNPYFDEMGLTHAKDMKQGTIDIYRYYNEKLQKELHIAVEFTGYKNQKERVPKKSDIYFGFSSPSLKMITEGAWEISQYPHAPCKYTRDDVILTYYVIFNRDILEADIVEKDDLLFTFIHRKTTPIREDNENVVFTQDYDARPNYRRLITRATMPVDAFILSFFMKNKVFYSTNEVGDIMTNYIKWCRNNPL